MAISPSRIAAFECLLAIDGKKAYSADALATAESSLGEKDRGLCHEIVLGSLRRQIYLDRLITKFAGAKKLDLAVRVALRIGIYQLLFLDRIPAFSAINESVELVRRAKKASATGFANAILRRITREGLELVFDDDIDRISVETSHPRWLIERWIVEFGSERAIELAQANNAEPPLAFRRTARTTNVDLDEVGRPSRYVPGCRLGTGDSRRLMELERAGVIYFQDESSQLVAAAAVANTGGSTLDVCAAPGSKTGMIRMSGRDLIVAGDLTDMRLATLRSNLERQGTQGITLCRYDAAAGLPFADNTFDVVIVDAPCSGTGTIRHNPEIRYNLTNEDFVRHSSKQLKIALNASKALKKGGRMIYSTCSIERIENEDVIAGLLAERPDLVVTRPEVNERFITEEGFARTFPDRDDMDGFFIAQLTRSD
ncbi:MAG: 16S rRNA (cytosine(967)-C(5))-methyltransferase RsmB [Pyrinomonadaceae bacterium]|nr:16S rRNA (cytosine(967)-C(5))-methyltransferase RsmB [Pyrinomonadaceae bacterium]